MNLTLLVVDDDDAVREMLVWMLEEAGHAVFEAGHGCEALEFLYDHGPVDLVLSDINMPLMDGIEMAHQLGLAYPAMPILLISGRPAPLLSRPFLPKPFRWDVLSRAITNLTMPGQLLAQ